MAKSKTTQILRVRCRINNALNRWEVLSSANDTDLDLDAGWFIPRSVTEVDLVVSRQVPEAEYYKTHYLVLLEDSGEIPATGDLLPASCVEAISKRLDALLGRKLNGPAAEVLCIQVEY